jgi:uncharacterized sulfatase
LAAAGATFTNAFTVTPVCSPSRATTMCGRLGTQVGITDWINTAVEPGLGLSPSETTWPEVLHQNGYATGLFGKWHLGDDGGMHPLKRGYDVFAGFRAGGTKSMDPPLEIDGILADRKGATADLVTDQALRFIDAHKAGAPFLVSLHFREPHTPYAPVRKLDSDPYAGVHLPVPEYPGLDPSEVEEVTRKYYASIHSVDRNVGRVLEKLDTLGLADHTIVIFTSDHGYNIGHHGLWHKGNGVWMIQGPLKGERRPNMFDTSIRVPQLVRWPGKVAPGSSVTAVVSNLDTFPTLLALAGLPMPEALKPRLTGRSWASLVQGQPDPAWDDTLFGQYDMHHGAVARMRMIRTPQWKWIRHDEPNGVHELYDLKSDPSETTNRADDSALSSTRDELDKKLRDWMKSVDDPLLRIGS